MGNPRWFDSFSHETESTFFLAGSPTAVFPAVVDHRKLAVGTNFNDQVHEVLLS